MLEVHLLLEAPQEWIKTMRKEHSALVRISDIRSEKSTSYVQDLVEISSPQSRAEELMTAISQPKNIRNSDLVQLDTHRIIGMVTANDCPVCPALAGLNCSLLSASSQEDNKMEWKLLISDEDTLKSLMERFSSKGINYSITQVSCITAKNELTKRQQQIAKISLELGYFEFPKKIRLEELARRLDISAGTLSETLRRAEKNIFTKYFQEHSHT